MAAPITALTLEGHPEACDTKTKDLHSPELGQIPPTPPKPLDAAAWRGCRLPETWCAHFYICGHEASRDAAFTADSRIGVTPGPSSRMAKTRGRDFSATESKPGNLPPHEQVAGLRHQVVEQGYYRPRQVAQFNPNSEKRKGRNNQSFPKRTLFRGPWAREVVQSLAHSRTPP